MICKMYKDDATLNDEYIDNIFLNCVDYIRLNLLLNFRSKRFSRTKRYDDEFLDFCGNMFVMLKNAPIRSKNLKKLTFEVFLSRAYEYAIEYSNKMLKRNNIIVQVQK